MLYLRHHQTLFGPGAEGQRSIAPFYDFWAYCLKHELVWLCLVFLRQLGTSLQPLVLDVDSGKVNRILRLGIIEQVLKHGQPHEDALTSAMSHLSTIMTAVRRRWFSLEWNDFETRAAILQTGDHYLVRYGSDPADCPIAIAQLHAGAVAYDPATKGLALRLFDLVAIKSQAVKVFTARLVRKDGLPTSENGETW